MTLKKELDYIWLKHLFGFIAIMTALFVGAIIASVIIWQISWYHYCLDQGYDSFNPDIPACISDNAKD